MKSAATRAPPTANSLITLAAFLVDLTVPTTNVVTAPATQLARNVVITNRARPHKTRRSNVLAFLMLSPPGANAPVCQHEQSIDPVGLTFD